MILSIIAIIASFPVLSKIVLYHFYVPKLDVFFPPAFSYSEKVLLKPEDIANGKVINIRNNDKREFIIQIEFILDKPWKLIDDRRILESGLKSGYQHKAGFYFKTETFQIPGNNSITGLRFPFEIKLEECSVDIIIYPKVHMSEFGLPRYFGECDLKPVKKHFELTPLQFQRI
ncbi:hypothetical protein E3E35_07990 [Thermococcus sp. GR7]|uniref:hypothetical protein n=1 Tax=unclassified Thermococcus TaxID=2627626 RepID=UPI001431FCF6|nr:MULTISPECIES: hypothetical protein [unclassified Thermococcus]NJE47339.1 hypothetical protein [Thermococcus sp. GR7]NJE79450.1 hypothetical protein [Thermococcus sp. GR4]NJF23171.1 hypothetical protein [Thermococcus sp. GR5]